MESMIITMLINDGKRSVQAMQISEHQALVRLVHGRMEDHDKWKGPYALLHIATGNIGGYVIGRKASLVALAERIEQMVDLKKNPEGLSSPERTALFKAIAQHGWPRHKYVRAVKDLRRCLGV